MIGSIYSLRIQRGNAIHASILASLSKLHEIVSIYSSLTQCLITVKVEINGCVQITIK